MIDKRKVDNLLEELNFADSLAGTNLIRQGVAMVEAQRAISMTKELYPALAKATGRTAGAVERNMRTAIENAVECSSGYIEARLAWQRFIGGQAPTVGEVLARMARRCCVEN